MNIREKAKALRERYRECGLSSRRDMYVRALRGTEYQTLEITLRTTNIDYRKAVAISSEYEDKDTKIVLNPFKAGCALFIQKESGTSRLWAIGLQYFLTSFSYDKGETCVFQADIDGNVKNWTKLATVEHYIPAHEEAIIKYQRERGK